MTTGLNLAFRTVRCGRSKVRSHRELLHHVAEFVKLDLSVAVLINLFKQLIKVFIVLVVNAQCNFDLVRGNCTAAIFVE